MATEKFFFFYGTPFSQWWRSKFVINGDLYDCAEQYMMAEKARLFGDKEIEDRIMKSKNPAAQKALGKMVKGFDKEKWEAVARDIVTRGNIAKFSTQKECYDFMMATGDDTIVEASPTDTIWGIGLSERDEKRFDRSNWRGTNWLGECLMKVRDELRAGNAPLQWEVYGYE